MKQTTVKTVTKNAPSQSNNKLKYATIIIGTAALLFVVILLLFKVAFPWYRYSSAVSMIEKGEYAKAYETLLKIEDFDNSKELIKNFIIVPEGKTSTASYTDSSIVTRYIYDKNGNCTKENITSATEGNATIERTFDEHNNMIEKVHTHPEEGTKRETYKYTYQGDFVTELTVTDSFGKAVTTKYTYDENGNCILEVSDENSVKIAYSKSGKPTLREISTSNGNKITYKYTYDNRGNLVKEIRTNSSGNEETTVYTYDENSLCIKKEISDLDGYMQRTTYVYDDDRFCIKETIIDNNKSTETVEYGKYKVFYRE